MSPPQGADKGTGLEAAARTLPPAHGPEPMTTLAEYLLGPAELPHLTHTLCPPCHLRVHRPSPRVADEAGPDQESAQLQLPGRPGESAGGSEVVLHPPASSVPR